MAYIVGCDPGMTGAFALLRDGKLIDVIDMPVEIVGTGKKKVQFNTGNSPEMVEKTKKILTAESIRNVFQILLTNGVPTLYLEHVQEMPGQSGMFVFGHGVGLIHMAACIYKVPMIEVWPATWQRAVGGSSVKRSNCGRAAALFPENASLFKRVSMDHGRADAALIAYYGQSVAS